MCRGLVIITLLLISIGPLQSDASPVEFFRTLAERNEISPSPSSAPGVNLISGEPTVKETCRTVSASCQQKNMAACLIYPSSGSQGLFLLVMNDGESSLEVKIMFLPALTLKEIRIPSHQTEKINVTSYAEIGSSIVLNAGDGDCIIHMGAPRPQSGVYKQFPSYDTYVTPINGAYLLFLITTSIGGTWACCKLWKCERRHLDGVPYQELEMGNQTDLSSINVEAGEGWNEDWDDDWNEGKAVTRVRSKPANGLTSKSDDSNGWGKDWDD